MVDAAVIQPYRETGFVANFAPIHKGVALVRGVGATAARYTPWPLRLMLGVSFLVHGLPKLTAVGHAGFAAMLQGLSVPMSGFTAWLVGFIEVFGGVGLLLGAFTGLWAFLLAVDMVVAALLVHAPHGFNFMNIVGQTPEGMPVFGVPGTEVPLLYLAGLVSLLLVGAGPLSLDAWWDKRKVDQPTGTA
ncbi:MAG: DoxX family protein [Deltaproteobacteria bacterium]|nr:DoxX family protein [Deltaproteobacteria bacterium]